MTKSTKNSKPRKPRVKKQTKPLSPPVENKGGVNPEVSEVKVRPELPKGARSGKKRGHKFGRFVNSAVIRLELEFEETDGPHPRKQDVVEFLKELLEGRSFNKGQTEIRKLHISIE